MAIISFWNNSESETGQTVSIAAISTVLSISMEYNYKILILNTNHNDRTVEECFWDITKDDNKANLFSNAKTDLDTGITGVSKAILSQKTSPEIITNYTKTVFKDRLEILTDKNITKEDYETQRKLFKDIAKIASRYYDLVFIDLQGDINDKTVNSILNISDLIITTMPQRLSKINKYIQMKSNYNLLNKGNLLILFGRYDKKSKYNNKNISRYIKEKNVFSIPYNTGFFEATTEGKVADYFIKFRKISETNPNSDFIKSIKEITDGMILKLKELQMRV